MPSVATSALRFSDTRVSGLHCIAPAFKDLDLSATTTCPITEERRTQIEHIEDCIDLPPCARPTECFGPDDPPPDPPTCPAFTMTGPRRAVCGANPHFESDDGDLFHEGVLLAEAEAREKLIDSCGAYGLDFPTGANAQRYCFLSCASALSPLGSSAGDGCNPDLDPEITHPSLVIPITNATIEVRIRVGDETEVGSVGGHGL